MPKSKQTKRSKAALEDRFDFTGDGVAVGDRDALGSAIFNVEEKSTGAELSLKLWRKTGKPVDEDLRQLWLHEMRQVQRVMSYAGARDVVVDVIEFVEDDRDFGVVLERVGQPLSEKRKRVSRQHWLRNLGAPRPRILLWNNLKRVMRALGIIHAQGLVHGRLAADVIMTEGADEPDFRLGGFEWSLWLGAHVAGQSHAKIGPEAAANRAESYSFAADWRALGLLVAECLEAEIKSSGDVQASGKGGSSTALHVPERVLIKRLVAPSRMDQLDAETINRAIDDLIANVARAASARAGTFILTFDRQSKLGEAVYDATAGEIPIDEYRRQLEWVRADLDGGATLLVPKTFDPATSWLRLVTDAVVYRLRAFRDEGTPVWDLAVCQAVDIRSGTFSLGESDEHPILQPISIAANSREAQELRGRLGPDVLDWSTFANLDKDGGTVSENDTIRRALLLVQTVEAVVKALEVYPVEILDTGRRDGRKFVTLRAEPNNDRDRIAKKVGLSESAIALARLFEEEHRDAEAKWRLSQAASLGATRIGDVVVTFVDVVDHKGRQCYQFEIDEELPDTGPFFLRTERDTGTEQVIARRLRNIKALDTRIDLLDMLADPWRVRQSSHDTFSDEEKKDEAFLDLDKPKQDALVGLWSTLPSYFVVGPPGVGKTKLATEVVRRRFLADRSTRMLITAQGHDALDNLQKKITETLGKAGLADLLVVRSTTSERRPTSDEEVHRAGLSYLERLSRSTLARDAPAPTRARISVLKAAASRLESAKDTVDRDERSGLGAVSHLVLDAANIVISTANSPDIERLVEAREQFDWVVVEEAAKATGPELIGPLMLSGRRLLIGDHHQLPPFEADRLVKILADHSLVNEALRIAEQLIGPLLRDGELDELDAVSADAPRLRKTADIALRLLEPFRTFVEDDERRGIANPGHRRIAATLTEQRRMDPAIAEIVSKAFYHGRLTTEVGRARAAENEDSPIIQLGALPKSPVVVVNFAHVSSTGHSSEIERGRPRWHNPSEVQAVIDVLRLVRARDATKPPTLAILSPYKAQVEKLHERIASIKTRELGHLDQFLPVRSNRAFVGTVDSFQGSEADLVILSLVRNNSRTGGGALGFLRDRRRMNVALSRAKSQLIIVGSLAFLKEAVRGVNPDAESHDLSFLSEIAGAIADLTGRKRSDIPLAKLISPSISESSSMSVLIAVPVFRVGCKVGIDRGRSWSVIDEVILWAITRQSKTIASLAADADLPHQIVVASIARLMRFRLVEVAINDTAVTFRASEYGFKVVSSGNPLPFFPKRISRRVSFVIEWATGDFFATRQVRLMTPYKLDEARRIGAEVRIISVDGGGPSMSHEANLNRLSDIAARGWDEQVAMIDGRTATMRDDEYMVLRVIDGEPQGLPESAGPELRRLVSEAATLPRGTTNVPVTYTGPREISGDQSPCHSCSIDANDVVIGGSVHRECLERLLEQAHRRVVVHSTFLDAARFRDMTDAIRAACLRGVSFDLLWGAEKDEDTESRNATAASQIALIVREDADLRGRFRVHTRTTGSHAKLILLDTAEDGWIASVGSCNWLSSPFQSVELSVVLRDQHVVADIAVALQRLVGRRGLSDNIATEMAINARDMRRTPSPGGNATVSVIIGTGHDRLIRTARAFLD